jgi:hypothetical protein
MTDERIDIEGAEADVEPTDAEPGEPKPEGEPDLLPGPTRSTRTRPSALDLARAFD